MLSTILVYVSLFLQVAAAVIAISLFKRTKFNASWILISIGFLLMVVSRVFDLWPTIYPEMEDELAIVQKVLAFIIALVLLIGVFYIRKIFQFMRRVDEIRRESEKRVLAAVIRTEEQERQRFAKELHDGLGPLLSVIKMLVSGLDTNKESEVNEKIKQNLRQAVDEAISGVRDISANISPHILNNFGLKDAVEAFIKRMRQADNFKVYFTTNLENQRFNYNIEVVVYRTVWWQVWLRPYVLKVPWVSLVNLNLGREAVAEIKLRSRQYAKRQLTWLRRNRDIHWFYRKNSRDLPAALQFSTEILTNLGVS